MVRLPGTSVIHFHVHPGLAEIRAFAEEQGWLAKGFTELDVAWLELHFTTDGWATTRVLKSTDVPSPITDGWCSLPRVAAGETVEFAMHAGLTCRAPGDPTHGMFREQGELWFNNGGSNYAQTAR